MNIRKILAPFWPQMVVLGYALFSWQPLARNQLTCSDDGTLHLLRAVSLEGAMLAGHWLPRWLPDMAQAYGYPSFNFYGPLPSYFLVGLRAFGLSYPMALHVLMALGVLIAGLAMLQLVQRWWGPWAGVVAAMAYMSAPYMGFDILFRGALAETLGLMWPPLILLALDIGLRDQQRSWQVLAAVCYAALLYTHNVTAFLMTPVIGAYGLLLVAEQPNRPSQWRVGQQGLAIGLTGLGLSVRFWLPALLETNLVQTARLLAPPNFTYSTNFITLSELLALPSPLQPLLINPSPAKGLGLVLVALACLGLLTAIIHKPDRARLVLFGGLLCFAGLMSLPESDAVWQSAPFLQVVQFPWRWHSVGMLCAALLAGAMVRWWPKRGPWVGSGVAVVLVLSHLFWWSPRYCSPMAPFGLPQALLFEQATGTIGGTAKGEFLPITVRQFPPESTVAEALIAGESPQWLLGLPDTALIVTRNDPLNYRAQLNLSTTTLATFHQFYFPGWQVRLNRQVLPIQVQADSGLMQFTLPPGEHTLEIYFGPTPLRALAEGITLFTFLTLLIVSLRVSPGRLTAPNPPPPAMRGWQWWPVLLPLALFGFKLLVIDTTHNPLRQAQVDLTGSALPNGLVLLGSQAPAQVSSGGPLEAVLTLSSPQVMTQELRPKFTLESGAGLVWNSPNDGLPPRWHREPPPTFAWPPGHIAQWARLETVLPGTPPGEYRLRATIFDLNTLIPNAEWIMGTVQVTRPTTPASPADLQIQYRQTTALAPELTLLGYNIDREAGRPGDPLLVTLFWQAELDMSRDITVALSLGDSTLWQVEPTPGYPTSQWQAGDVWFGQHAFFLPAELETGRYALRLNGKELAELNITAPERQFSLPSASLTAAHPFEQGLGLVGANWSALSQDQPLSITLYWQAETTPTTMLRSFVHLLNEHGQIVAQSDSLPADGQRPSTGWLPGEVVSDIKLLTLPAALPAGEYTLVAGLAEVVGGGLVPAQNSPDGRAVLGAFTLTAP